MLLFIFPYFRYHTYFKDERGGWCYAYIAFYFVKSIYHTSGIFMGLIEMFICLFRNKLIYA